jgi:hypothetical protein
VRNGATIVPLDLEAGIVEHGTPALGFRICARLRQGPHAQLRGGHEGRQMGVLLPVGRTRRARGQGSGVRASLVAGSGKPMHIRHYC